MSARDRSNMTQIYSAKSIADQGAPRSGFSVIELLLTLTVIGVLIALIVPAVQSARESSRRAQCLNNLRQIALATLSFEGAHRHFPLSVEIGTGRSVENWVTDVLPYMDGAAFCETFKGIQGDFVTGRGDPRWSEIELKLLETAPPGFHCPSDPLRLAGTLSYPGNAGTWVPQFGYNGIFREGGKSPEVVLLTGQITAADVTDGLSNTMMVSEWLHGSDPLPKSPVGSKVARRWIWHLPINVGQGADVETLVDHCRLVPKYAPEQFGWRRAGALGYPWFYSPPGYATYYHAMTPNKASCKAWVGGWGILGGLYTAGSLHINGVNAAFADGRAKFISDDVDPAVWRDYGSRSSIIGIMHFND